jgi:hypothetical protein
VNTSKAICTIGLSALLLLAPAADAQRASAGAFGGNWKGTLTMDAIVDVPADQLARMSKPVELEIRVENRGGAEIYFTFEEEEWEFTDQIEEREDNQTDGQRGFRLTPIGDQNAVIEARVVGNNDWISSITLNLTLLNPETLLVSWSRFTVRDQWQNNGFDEFGMAGVATLARIGD